MYQPFHWLSFHSLFRSRLMQSLWITWDFFTLNMAGLKNITCQYYSGQVCAAAGQDTLTGNGNVILWLDWENHASQVHSVIARWKLKKNWKCHIFRNETELLQDDGPSHVCNPITHKCSCERGYTPALSESGDKALVCRKLGAVSWQLKYLF